MKILSLLLISYSIVYTHQMFCNFYPLDSKACITQTKEIKCYFNQFEGSCIETQSSSHGCQPTLNQLACQNQLTNAFGEEARCTFGKSCVNIKNTHLIKLGCYERFSKYACTNVLSKDCIWNGKQCAEYQGKIPEQASCEAVFSNSVTPSLCQKIQNLKCMNGGFQKDYQCINVNEQQLSLLKCADLGLNQYTCISIITPNQRCIFYKDNCRDINQISITKCEMELNRLGCLGISNPNLFCQWDSGKCKNFVKLIGQTCENIKEVNASVCQQFEGKCKYDTQNFNCKIPSSSDKLTCNTKGLTKDLCISLKNQFCTFTNGYCEEITLQDLKQYQCEMLLNEDSCVNVQTQYQYCKWDGKNCIRQIINQDLDCELDKNDNISKYNGNVCQAISKPNVLCKYNAQKNRCILSDQNDQCNSPYINLFGCISITKPGLACQWTLNGCIQIEIQALVTKCDSLQFANPFACSQIDEDSNTGCYFNQSTQKCQSIKIDQQNGINLLNTLECQNIKQGLNKIACASITTPGQICRWNQNQCQQIRKKVDVAQVECLNMKFVNPQACALVEFGKEPCRYLKSEMSCVNSIFNTMNCYTPGLNTYACAQVVGSCYFDTIQNKCVELDSINPDNKTQITELLQTMQCQSSSPTKDVCTQIITIGELCQWSDRQSRCLNQTVLLNQKCSNYSSNVQVNANVCAAIEMDFPDYDLRYGINSDVDRGYCKFMPETGTCSKNTDSCITPCCTEKIGINAHSCTRFSSQAIGVYCFFGSNLRCQQLTSDVVDITKSIAVKNYYNANQMKCSSMTRNSCHMIEWSTKQLCYHNGKSCVNLNYSNYGNLDVFIQYPAILNRYGCLAIEATITKKNTLKYFLYDEQYFRCKLKVDLLNYATCELAIGNSNVCLRFTENTLCKWNSDSLKCQTITNDEYDEIYTCSYNQNKKACIENPNTSCQFSLINDKCIDAPTDVLCNYFNTNGPVGQSACLRIIKDGQRCEYDSNNNACKYTSISSNGCNVTGANSITCYKNTGGYCRWNPLSNDCYENQTEISQLGCEDYLNQNLCVLVTKEPCVWDDTKFKCLKITSTDKQFVSSKNSYNRLGCYSITGGAFYHDSNYKCVELSQKNYTCQQEHLNEYACLFHTQQPKDKSLSNYLCYFDHNESPQNHRCKPFTSDQTQCSTDVAISIEVCMQIPKSCYFNSNTLKCIDVEISETQTCTNLRSQQTNGFFYNRISCVSISEFLDSTDGVTKCYGSNDNVQECNFEKYCLWNQISKSCEIWQPTASNRLQTSSCGDGCTPTPYCYQDTSEQSISNCSNIYSRALCLQIVTEQCYFDINQGGCLPIENNQHKLSDCTSIVNTCDVSYTPGVVCMKTSADPEKQPGNQCSSVVKSIKKCINNGSIQLGLKCDDYQDETNAVICASASDACRFNNKCVSDQPSVSQNENLQDKCDKSMSKTMCLNMQCDYTLNYCQKTASVPQKTDTNKYALCYEVNLLKITNRDSICSQVDQACIYTSRCDDATGYTCSQLTSNKVSKKACINCSDQIVKYDPTNYRCIVITTETFASCDDNLNYHACLKNTPNILCKWVSNTCTLISDLSSENSTDCSIYNQNTCPQLNSISCYVNSATQLCTTFNPQDAKCSDNKKKNLCLQSNYERCKWDDQNSNCIFVNTETNYDCEIANQYGCLNMKSTKCGWSSQMNACFKFNYKDNYNECNSFVKITNNNDSNNTDPDRQLVKFNGFACSNLNIKKSCFRDEQFRCREIISADQLKCDSPGVNEYSCVNNAVGKCKYLKSVDSNSIETGVCVEDLDTKIGCSNLLNVEACLNQDTICKFVNKICQIYDISTQTQLNTNDKFPYSLKVCSAFDDQTTESIVYSPQKLRCVKATSREPFINNCSQLGINKYACLNKTTGFCRYDSTKKQCLSVTREELINITNCDASLSWAACIKIDGKCQFVSNKCQPVPDNNTCQNLQDSKTLTNPLVCQTRQNPNDKACKQDIETKMCNVVTSTTEVCSQPGLNKIGCIFNTKGSLCIYLDNYCTTNYENVNCADLINEDKCLSIRTKGQYCKFDSILGCVNIANPQITLQTCLQTFTTNPISCSISSDVPCLYDNTNNKCKQVVYSQNSDDEFYIWQNRLSFNKMACLKYNLNNLPVYWMDECMEILSSQFISLTCDKLVNIWGCLQITNPVSNCHYNSSNSICEEADLQTYAQKDCKTIVDINNPRFCEINNFNNVKCKYDSVKHACIETTSISDCEDKGYNIHACQSNPQCQFNKKCYKKLASGSLFCNDAANINDCKLVQSEGCDKSCNSLTDYSSVNCEDAINLYGCKKITKSQQYCVFKNQLCSSINPKTFLTESCNNVININNSIYCEQPSDVGCYYDQESNNCKSTTLKNEFGCIRGINQIACLSSTTSTLQCKFFDYCYGPNAAILNCKVEDNNKPNACCQNANTIESCLFQSKFQCSWNTSTNACDPYVVEEKECGMIENKSKLVCLSKTDTFCIFNTEFKKCEQIQAFSCNQAQSYQQCQMIDNLPCIWDDQYQICKYKEKQNEDQCQDIKKGYGNRLACLGVERMGQTCQFNNGQCETFQESKTNDNCLNNINKVACTQQQSSKCYWKYSEIKIKINSWSQESSLQIGECQQFTDFNNSSCEEYLSYLSCFSIYTTGKQCKWQNGKCQQIEYNKSSLFTLKDLILVNSNACSLINNGDMVQYNPKSFSCKLVSDPEQISCQPLTDGINKQACLKIRTQYCQWDDLSLRCIFKKTRLLVEEQIQQYRQLQSIFSCKKDGIGPKLCKQLNFELPCGSVEDGCDLININTATCEDPGLNKYACLNLTTGPCAWVKDDDTDYYHCEEYYPYSTCENIEYSVNSLACTYVEDDPCVYNKFKQNCELPQSVFNQCEIEGINAIACSNIKGCIFKNQKCLTWDPNYNILCNQAEKANQSICQLAIDRCKYSELTFGCIASTITDNCFTNGLSALGCNVLDECQWADNSCQCLAYLNKYPICNAMTEYAKCTNVDYCFFEVSQSKSSKDITQYLKNTNYGTCRQKTCADVEINKCNQTNIDKQICYLNSKGKCLSANKCEDISDSSLSCLQYKINNRICRQKQTNSCQTLDCSLISDQSECEQFTNECVYTGYCRIRSCEYMGKLQCLSNNCDWNSTSEKCQIQLDCSQITNADICIAKKQKDSQCAWLVTTNQQQQCTSTGCRYLGKSQGDCMGTHIGNDVCVQMIDFSCVSCQEIKDACICLNQSQYCSYDKINQKCFSKSCQSHNKEDCPITHCRFNSVTQICQPLCQYNYNQLQCNQSDECLWNTSNQICVPYNKEVVIEQINLPSPDSNKILDIIILILIMIY